LWHEGNETRALRLSALKRFPLEYAITADPE
jgi:hypothetical protein